MKPINFLRNALFAVLPGVLLTACQSQQQETALQPSLGGAYSMEAVMDYDGSSASLSMTRLGEEQWEILFTEPPALAGVMLSFEGNAVSASYKGLAFSVPKSALPAKNMLALTTEIFDTVSSAEPLSCTQNSDGTLQCTGESSGGSYTLTFAEQGLPIALEIPSQPLKITFSSYTNVTTETETTTAPTQTESTETTNEGTSN